MRDLLEDLRQRHVFRVAIIYAVTAWLLIQVAVAIAGPLKLPEWFTPSIIAFLALSFPVAMIMAYALEITPDGVRSATGTPVKGEAGVHRFRNNMLYGACTLVLIAIVGWQGASLLQPSSPAHADVFAQATDVSAPVPGYDGRSAIAVLPFVHMSDDVSGDYIADGITEDIITSLYSYRSVPVIARTSTFGYKNSNKPIPQIAEELGAGYVVSGSVRVLSTRTRVTAQLIGADGTQVWAESIDLNRDKVMEGLDDVTHRIAAAVVPEVMSSEAAKMQSSPPSNMQAWDLYLKARSLSAEHYAFKTINGEPLTIEKHEEARDLIHQALALDPNFAAAYALLTHIDGVYVVLLHMQVTPEERMQALDRALRNAAKSHALSPFDASTCSCQILLLLVKNEVSRAVALADQAVTINPGNAVLISGAAKAYQVAGKNEQALKLIERAKRLSPRDMSIATFLGFESLIHIALGDFEAAAQAGEQGILLDPGNFLAHLPRILAHYAMDDLPKARKALKEMRAQLYDLDPERAWPWPEPIPGTLLEQLPPDVRARTEGETLAALVKEVIRDLDRAPQS